MKINIPDIRQRLSNNTAIDKEEREKGVKGNILGNAKDLSKDSKKDVDGYPKNSQQNNPSYNVAENDGLPF